MSIRYTTVAMSGLNDPSKRLSCADEHPLLWDAFADAKAAVAARVEIVHEHLDSSDCDYKMHSVSGDHHYEISFEFGPRSSDPALPFKLVFRARKCRVTPEQTREIEP